jgi:[FeFe] hydrogenase (group B1/B3)
MRNYKGRIATMRRKVFAAVAQIAYEGDYKRMDRLPYELTEDEGEDPTRPSIFLERAIVGERVRLAMGLPLRTANEHSLLSDGVDRTAIADKYYDPPLINIIKYACNACPPTHYEVSAACRGCLARNCQNVCPKGAIFFNNGKAEIDQSKCIKCGLCKNACSYQTIIRFERPCAEACGMDAIGMDAQGRAEIDQNKCVSCGMCLVNCSFGAIVDKGQLFQLIHAIKRGDKVIAIIAPAFWGQFGDKVTPGQIKAAMKQLGFDSIQEVAVGADLCSIQEAEEFVKKVPEEMPFMATSCCPSWSVMAKKEFPDFAPYISMSLTPMVLTARLEKRNNPGCRIAFIGPCAAKKLEASRRTIRSYVDFVLTFEELQAMFQAKGIDISKIEAEPFTYEASSPGIGFAASGGVADSVAEVIKRTDPELEVRTYKADGLRECRKMLRIAKTGKLNGYLLEGMACPGGCIAGAGTVLPPEQGRTRLQQYKNNAPIDNPLGSQHMDAIDLLIEGPED